MHRGHRFRSDTRYCTVLKLHATAACRQTMRTLLYRSDGLLPKSEHVR